MLNHRTDARAAEATISVTAVVADMSVPTTLLVAMEVVHGHLSIRRCDPTAGSYVQHCSFDFRRGVILSLFVSSTLPSSRDHEYRTVLLREGRGVVAEVWCVFATTLRMVGIRA